MVGVDLRYVDFSKQLKLINKVFWKKKKAQKTKQIKNKQKHALQWILGGGKIIFRQENRKKDFTMAVATDMNIVRCEKSNKQCSMKGHVRKNCQTQKWKTYQATWESSLAKMKQRVGVKEQWKLSLGQKEGGFLLAN